ncbi:MAG: glycoside hydrolase family 127 protein [Acidobacteriaceae bacterium]|nr:glycoside hydrolase family 127 protein [Acidobacteriaceae bacterium]
MTQVRVLGGAYKDAQEWNRAYMQRLSADRLVRNFQTNAGFASSAKPLGGWETDVPSRPGELRGHFMGHYLSAVALMYASTPAEQATVRRLSRACSPPN